MASPLPILTFHALDDRSSVISFSPRVFRRGIAKLYENGYRTIGLLEAVDFLQQGKSFPDRSFVITFDDGYKSVFDEAFPVLQQYGMSATVFLTVGKRKSFKPSDRLPPFEGRPMLSWQEIREMRRWDVDFGSHTLTHPDLTCLTAERIEVEICKSKAIIEDVLSTPVTSFAYPFGRYDNQSRGVVREHFACACSDKLGFVTAGSDLYTLERVEAYYLRTDRLFDVMLTGFFPWYIRARNIPRGIRRSLLS